MYVLILLFTHYRDNMTTYVSVERVGEFLNFNQPSGFTSYTIPSSGSISRRIERVEDFVDRFTRHSYRSNTVSNEYYDWPYYRFRNVRWRFLHEEGSIHLRHYPIRTLNSALGDKLQVWNGSTYDDFLTSKTEGRANDYWVDETEGIIHFANCLEENTQILTQNRGLQKIKNVVRGDVVTTFDEETKRVQQHKAIGVIAQGQQPVYKLRLKTREIIATGNHPFLCIKKVPFGVDGRTHLTLQWKLLSQMKVGDVVMTLKERPFEGCSYRLDLVLPTEKKMDTNSKDIILPYETNEDLLWLLGFYLGDGSKAPRSLFFHEYVNKSKQHLILEKIEKLFGVRGTYSTRGAIVVNSVKLVSIFEQLGMTGDCYSKRIPQWVSTLPSSQIKSFIDGLVAADGHQSTYSEQKRQWSVVLCNEEIVRDLQSLCHLVGYSTGHVYKRIVRGFDKNSVAYSVCIYPDIDTRYCYSLCWGGKSRFVDEIQVVEYLERGANFESVKSIEKMGLAQTYDLTIENTPNFVANGIIVHNSIPFARKDGIRVTYRWGESSVPADIEYAATLLTAADIVSAEDYSVVFPTGTESLPFREKMEQWKATAMDILDRNQDLIVDYSV